jgi:hypothetical protein
MPVPYTMRKNTQWLQFGSESSFFYLDTDPDPGAQTNADPNPDPGQTLHEKYALSR